MQKIIRDKKLVDDQRIHVAAGAEVPDDADVTVCLADFLRDTEALLAHKGGLGVRIAPGEGIAEIVPYLDRLDLVCVEFPTFFDGRGLSYARELRERHRYGGEIRALGDVQRDQVFGMYRCGINAFEIKEGKSIADALLAFGEFSGGYQGDTWDPRPVYRRG